jgi:hypothetical protein
MEIALHGTLAKAGDANTKYFHTLASIRRSQNHIPEISLQIANPNDTPTTITHSTQILAEFTTFYRDILGSQTLSLFTPNLTTFSDSTR